MLGSSGPGVHEEILSGRDTTITWEDVFKGDELRACRAFMRRLRGRLGCSREVWELALWRNEGMQD